MCTRRHPRRHHQTLTVAIRHRSRTTTGNSCERTVRNNLHGNTGTSLRTSSPTRSKVHRTGRTSLTRRRWRIGTDTHRTTDRATIRTHTPPNRLNSRAIRIRRRIDQALPRTAVRNHILTSPSRTETCSVLLTRRRRISIVIPRIGALAPKDPRHHDRIVSTRRHKPEHSQKKHERLSH